MSETHVSHALELNAKFVRVARGVSGDKTYF